MSGPCAKATRSQFEAGSCSSHLLKVLLIRCEIPPVDPNCMPMGCRAGPRPAPLEGLCRRASHAACLASDVFPRMHSMHLVAQDCLSQDFGLLLPTKSQSLFILFQVTQVCCSRTWIRRCRMQQVMMLLRLHVRQQMLHAPRLCIRPCLHKCVLR